MEGYSFVVSTFHRQTLPPMRFIITLQVLHLDNLFIYNILLISSYSMENLQFGGD
jgi:hypothetical protein